MEDNLNAKSVRWILEYAQTLVESTDASLLAAVYRLRERLQDQKWD